MKNINSFFLAFILIFASANVQAQCVSENDFPDLCVASDGTDPADGTVNYDIDGDSTDDLMITMTAVANATTVGDCVADGDFAVGGCVGAGGALTTTSDFAGTTLDDCLCTGGYVKLEIDLINGFESLASVLDLDWTSLNGSTEGYEWAFGYVQASDANGTPIAPPSFTEADILNFCNAEYIGASQTMTQFLGITGAVGLFTADDRNTTFGGENGLDDDGNVGVDYVNGGNVCDGFSDNQFGEDTPADGVSGSIPPEASGPNNASNIQAVNSGLGFGATDLATKIVIYYGLSNAPGSDCPEDGVIGDTGVESSPGGSWGEICFVQPPPACSACTEGTAGLVITELSYDPSTAQGSDGDCEYIELFNSYSNSIVTDANTTVALSTGLSFTLPAGTTIASGEYIIVAIDPVDFATCTWGTPPPAGTQIFGPTSGSLSNSGEDLTVTLACALDASQDFTQTVSFSDATTPDAGGGGNSVYYPLDGSGPLEATPSPGSGDCAACANTEFTCGANCSIAGTLEITEACGVLTIEVTGITESMTSGTGFVLDLLDDGASIETSATIASATTEHTFTVTPAADGSSVFTVTITDAGDAACTSTAGPVTSPASTAANVPTFVPNGSTTTTP